MGEEQAVSASEALNRYQFTSHDMRPFTPNTIHPNEALTVRAMPAGDPNDNIGYAKADADGKVMSIWTHPDHRRAGVARSMVEHLQKSFPEVKVSGSSNRTDAGDAFARNMGAEPRKTSDEWTAGKYGYQA